MMEACEKINNSMKKIIDINHNFIKLKISKIQSTRCQIYFYIANSRITGLKRKKYSILYLQFILYFAQERFIGIV